MWNSHLFSLGWRHMLYVARHSSTYSPSSPLCPFKLDLLLAFSVAVPFTFSSKTFLIYDVCHFPILAFANVASPSSYFSVSTSIPLVCRTSLVLVHQFSPTIVAVSAVRATIVCFVVTTLQFNPSSGASWLWWRCWWCSRVSVRGSAFGRSGCCAGHCDQISR